MAGRKGQKSANATSFGAKNGNDPRKGNRNGRPAGYSPEMWRKRYAFLAEKAAEADRWERIFASTDYEDVPHAAFLSAVKEVNDRFAGRAPQSVDVTSGGNPLPAVVLLPPKA